MDVDHEFTTANDLPIHLATSPVDSTVAVGYRSGFLRIFDLSEGKLVAETMIYESPVQDL